jgi:hypothetical protein
MCKVQWSHQPLCNFTLLTLYFNLISFNVCNFTKPPNKILNGFLALKIIKLGPSEYL